MKALNKATILFFLAIGFLAGSFLAHVFYADEVATEKAEKLGLEAKYNSDVAATKQAALSRIQQANARSDSLQTALDISEQRRTITEKEMQREIQRNTTGRACLNARTVSLLNHRAATGGQATTLPAPSSQPAQDSSSVATDSDIANWANTAITQYGTCKDRLDALIAWHSPAGAEQHD